MHQRLDTSKRRPTWRDKLASPQDEHGRTEFQQLVDLVAWGGTHLMFWFWVVVAALVLYGIATSF